MKVNFRQLVFVFTFGTLLVFGLFIYPKNASAAGRISLSHSTLDLVEGESQVVTIALDEPIIAPGPDAGYVDIDINVGGSDRITLDIDTMSIPASEWFQPHTFTVTAIDDDIDNGDETASVITLSAVSNSEYYSGFNAADIAVEVTDNDDTTPIAGTDTSGSVSNESTNNATTTPKLADTGNSIQPLIYAGFALLMLAPVLIFAIKTS